MNIYYGCLFENSRNKKYIKLINNAEQLFIRVMRSKLHQGMAVIYKIFVEQEVIHSHASCKV